MAVSPVVTGATGGPIHPMVAKWRESVDRAEKSQLVDTLSSVFKDTGVIVVAHYSGLSVAQMTALRARMREAGGGVRVAKNRLVKLALKGTDAEAISDLFEGPTVIAFSKDPVAAAKAAIDFAKVNDKLVIRGGAMGKTALDADGVKALATLPSLDELRGKLVGLIASPATKVAQVLNAPAAQLARVLSAYAEKSAA
jgi:large subunit ribosomal protein L10